MLEEIIEQLRPSIIELFKDDSGGHDISHLIRTMKLALYIQSKEGGDKIVIGISAFLHDIHRIMQNDVGKYITPKESIPMVKKILENINLTNDQKDKICFCIEHHEEYNWNGNNVDDINTLILQDADNLDAIGAIGIARAFSYGGINHAKIYDENITLEEAEEYSKNNIPSPSTIHYFYSKLYKLQNNMNTKTAKEIATQRTDFMKNFVNEFLNEWNSVL